MSTQSEEPYAALEAAISRWNTRIGAAFPDMNATCKTIEQRLSTVAAMLQDRRKLPGHLMVARMKMEALQQSPEQREATVGQAMTALETLEQQLAGFHVELQTLVAQANRAIAAGATFARELAAIQGAGSDGLISGDDVPQPDFAPDASGALAARIQALEGENEQLRRQLQATEQRPVSTAIPAEVQTELVTLREEVETLRAERDATLMPRVVPPELAARMQQEALDDQGKKRPLGMILVRAGIISPEQLEVALREQRSSWNRHIGAILIDLGYANEIAIAQALAAQVKVPFVSLSQERLDVSALRMLSPQLAHHHSSVPIRFAGENLMVAMANPLDLVALEDLQLATNRNIIPVVATVSDIRHVLREHYPTPVRV